MDKKEIQKVVNDTENSLREEVKQKQIKKIKDIVTKLLKRKDELNEERDEIDKKLKYIKMDLDDLKDGRLDRIEERQKKDPDAKANAIVFIIKEVIREREVPVSPFYQPYRFIFPDNYVSDYPLTYTLSGADSSGSFNGTWCFTSSTVKNNVTGTYDINGHIVHLR